MSENTSYRPRHAAATPIDPEPETTVRASEGAEAAFASLVEDALADRKAAREAAAKDAADAVASLDMVEEAPLPEVGASPRVTSDVARTHGVGTAASGSDDSVLLHEAHTTLMDGRARRAQRGATAQGEARTTLIDGRAPVQAAGRTAAQVVSPGSTAPQRPQTPAGGATYVSAPTVRRETAAPARPAVPSQPYDYDDARYDNSPRRRGGSRGSGAARAGRATSSALIGFLALPPRLAAIGLCGLVVLCALPVTATRLIVINACNIADVLVPQALAGILVYETPFGGAFRGDFALLALVFFIIDWLLVKIAFAIWGEADV